MITDTLALSSADVALIRHSFAAAAADPAALTASFYRHLFAAEPDLRRMFPADLGPQEAKLAAMLGVLVAGLHDWPALEPAFEALGRRHQAFGVRAEHFPPVGAALLAALSEQAGGPLDAATETAWGRIFARMTATMTGNRAVRRRQDAEGSCLVNRVGGRSRPRTRHSACKPGDIAQDSEGFEAMVASGLGGATTAAGRNETVAHGGVHRDEALQPAGRSVAPHRPLA